MNGVSWLVMESDRSFDDGSRNRQCVRGNGRFFGKPPPVVPDLIRNPWVWGHANYSGSRKSPHGLSAPMTTGLTRRRRDPFSRLLSSVAIGMDEWYENGALSIVLALSRKPLPYPWTPASAGATVELLSSFHQFARPSQGHSDSERGGDSKVLQAATPNPT